MKRLLIILCLLEFYVGYGQISTHDNDNHIVHNKVEFAKQDLAEMFDVLYHHDFENNNLGAYDRETWMNDWNPQPPWRDSENIRGEDIYIKEVPNHNTQALELTFPKGSVSTAAGYTCSAEPIFTPGGGDYWTSYFTNNGGYDEVYFSYNVMFRPGFDFAKGGNCHLLQGDQSIVRVQPSQLTRMDLIVFSCLIRAQMMIVPRAD